MNKLNLAIWIALASIFILLSSCGKDNYDISDSTEEEFEPETEYLGEDNYYGFSFTVMSPGGTSTQGGIAVDNKIELIDSDLLKWKITSTVQDGDYMVLAETTFFTPSTDGGIFPLEELHLLFQDGSTVAGDYTWGASELDGNIEISSLDGTPEFVSGAIGVSMNGPATETNYQYVVEFSKIPID